MVGIPSCSLLHSHILMCDSIFFVLTKIWELICYKLKFKTMWRIDCILITDVPISAVPLFVWNIVMKVLVCHKYITLRLFWNILHLWLEVLTERERWTSVLATLEAIFPLQEKVAAILSDSDIIDVYVNCPWNYQYLSMTKFSQCTQNIIR